LKKMLHLTVADKPHEGLRLLFETAALQNIETRVLGYGSLQKIGHGAGFLKKGFGLKLSALKQELLELGERPVLFTDAFDVLFQHDLQRVHQKILEIGDKVLFAAEKTNWPDANLQYPQKTGPFPFLNSGVIAGRAHNILKLLQKPFDEKTDDQYYYAKQYVDGAPILLDHDAEFFLCLQGIQKSELSWNSGWSFQEKKPAVLHLNSGGTRIRLFVPLVSKLLPGFEKLARAAAWKSIFFFSWYPHRFFMAFCLVLLALYLLK